MSSLVWNSRMLFYLFVYKLLYLLSLFEWKSQVVGKDNMQGEGKVFGGGLFLQKMLIVYFLISSLIFNISDLVSDIFLNNK